MKNDAKILITGSSGYIGSALFKNLEEKGIKVVGYDIIEGEDIMDKKKLTRKMKEVNPDIVIHLAALSSVTACNEDINKAIMYNGVGTRNVLDAMKKCGCNKIIYAGTSSVYGNCDKIYLPYTEESKIGASSAYGLTKLIGELVIFNHFNNKENPGSYLIYRMFNVVGSSGYDEIDRTSNPGYDRLFSALESGKIIIYGNDYQTYDGTCLRDYVALKDICTAFIKGIEILKYRKDLKEIINICSGSPCSVDLIVNIWNVYSKKHKLPHIQKTYGKRREGDPAIVYGSNHKAKRILDWEPVRKIKDIIIDLANDKNL